METRDRAGRAEWNRRLKEAHMCRDCRKQDAYTFSGHVYCYECNQKRNEKAKRYREQNRESINRKRKQRYDARKAEYRCVFCGREFGFLDNGSLCAWCKAKKTRHHERDKVSRRIGGVCFQCCENPPMDGKKLCAACYEKNMGKLKKMWDGRKRKGAEV